MGTFTIWPVRYTRSPCDGAKGFKTSWWTDARQPHHNSAAPEHSAPASGHTPCSPLSAHLVNGIVIAENHNTHVVGLQVEGHTLPQQRAEHSAMSGWVWSVLCRHAYFAGTHLDS
jgi:hypothetical protein